MIRIYVRDNTRMGTQLLADVLRRDRRFELVDELDSENLAGSDVHVAVLCCNSSAPNGQFDIIRRLRAARPELKIIALLDDTAPATVLQAFRAGVRGIFCRNESYKTLTKCVIKVYNGHVWASQGQLTVLVEAIGQPFPMTLVDAKGATLLSNREEQVVHWVAEGLTNREIADRMQLSEHTVKNYLFRIFDKLGVSSRAELVLYAVSRHSSLSAEPPSNVDDNVSKNTHTHSSHAKVCPLLQFDLGRKSRGGDPPDNGYESAYVALSAAQQISSVIREKSAAALRELERVIPVEVMLQLEGQVKSRVREIVLALDAEPEEPTKGRAA